MSSPLSAELEKIRVAEHHGADTIMDLSTRDGPANLRSSIAHSKIPVGAVPIYTCFGHPDEDAFVRQVEAYAKTGAAYLTIHSAALRQGVEYAKKRVTKIVSRGGGIIAKYMHDTGKENPLYTNYDAILDIMRDSECVISLGDALRPGSLADANDKAQLHELKVQGELVLRARKAGVQVFCEGPGHMPLHTIADNMRLQKRVCHNAPYYVLGPLTTDRALGDDDVTGAIGGSIASAAGADFLCVVTPQEHYSLPTLEGIRDGTIATKIAAHSGDYVKLPWVRSLDLEMSKARFALDWTTQKKYSVTKRDVQVKDGAPCTMCLGLCPMNLLDHIIKEEEK
jgi:phosphomethylpyrimidine synthase